MHMYVCIYIYICICIYMNVLLLFFLTLVTGPRWSLSLQLSDTRVYEPQIRARLRTTAHFCKDMA